MHLVSIVDRDDPDAILSKGYATFVRSNWRERIPSRIPTTERISAYKRSGSRTSNIPTPIRVSSRINPLPSQLLLFIRKGEDRGRKLMADLIFNARRPVVHAFACNLLKSARRARRRVMSRSPT